MRIVLLRKKIHPKTSEEVNLRSSKSEKQYQQMNLNEKMKLLCVKFAGLRNILEHVKETYCNVNLEEISDIQYIASGNMLKRLTTMVEETEEHLDEYLYNNKTDFDEKLCEKIIKNIDDKYKKILQLQGEGDPLSMLVEDLNTVTSHIVLLLGLSTEDTIYNALNQNEYVIA